MYKAFASDSDSFAVRGGGDRLDSQSISTNVSQEKGLALIMQAYGTYGFRQ
jgi:hypothetical protein